MKFRDRNRKQLPSLASVPAQFQGIASGARGLRQRFENNPDLMQTPQGLALLRETLAQMAPCAIAAEDAAQARTEAVAWIRGQLGEGDA
jgi:hypothetical protein